MTVRGGSKIVAVGEDCLELDGAGRGMSLGDETLTSPEPFGMLVWSTGLAANPFVERLEGVSHDEKTKSCVYRIWTLGGQAKSSVFTSHRISIRQTLQVNQFVLSMR